MRSSHPLFLEALEDRLAPTVAGSPWPDAAHLTLSFAPDGTADAAQPPAHADAWSECFAPTGGV